MITRMISISAVNNKSGGMIMSGTPVVLQSAWFGWSLSQETMVGVPTGAIMGTSSDPRDIPCKRTHAPLPTLPRL